MVRFPTALIFLLCAPAGVAVAIVPPGIRSALMGDVVGSADFTLNIAPPQENADESRREIDALMQNERAVEAASLDDMGQSQRKMLDAEQKQIRAIVAKALAGLGARGS
ncbi:unnamed protein product [Effrenium voratum]|nr:unnamed protein product [Effrenium voratum]